MSNEAVVYWTSRFFPVQTPQVDHAYQDLHDRLLDTKNSSYDQFTKIKKCPAIVNHLANTFRVKNNVKYGIEWNGTSFTSKEKDQDFFNKNVEDRDSGTGIITLKFLSLSFFTDQPSLKMEAKKAVYSNNSFNKNTSFIEGVYDIGKWYRFSDLAFFVNNQNIYVPMEHGDVMFYVKFLTDSKVKLKRYYLSDKLDEISREIYHSRRVTASNNPMSGMANKLLKYYNDFQESKYKNIILKEIKNNLME